MDKPLKKGKGKRKKTGAYKNGDQVPAGGRARERVLQHRKARGLEDTVEATGEFSETVDASTNSSTDDSTGNDDSECRTGDKKNNGEEEQQETPSDDSKDEVNKTQQDE